MIYYSSSLALYLRIRSLMSLQDHCSSSIVSVVIVFRVSHTVAIQVGIVKKNSQTKHLYNNIIIVMTEHVS